MQIIRIKAIASIIFALWSVSAYSQHSILKIDVDKSDSLRIDAIYAPASENRIRIDGKWCSMRSSKKERIIRLDSKIELKKGEYIEFTDMRTRQSQLKICGDEFLYTKTSTIGDYVRVRGTKTKGRTNMEDFKSLIESGPWCIIEDTLYIPTSFLQNESHWFSMQLVHSDIDFTIPYDTVTNELVIMRNTIEINEKGEKTGIKLIANQDYRFVLLYWDGNDSEIISYNFLIRYVPKQ